MSKKSIKQVEPRFAQQLDPLLKTVLKNFGYSVPASFRLRVSLLNADGRKKRSNAAAETWAPESDRMQLWLEPAAMEDSQPVPESTPETFSQAPDATQAQTSSEASKRQSSSANVHPAEAELLRALDRAESTPGWSFVSLKKFRDEILPSAPTPSIRTDIERQNVLRSAIDKRLILRKPVPNPKSPQFPVTSIRVNRLLPEVQEILGQPKREPGFRPIHIKGEPLSATILRERR